MNFDPTDPENASPLPDNVVPFDYENALVRGELTAEEREAVVGAYVEDQDSGIVADKLNLPPALVARALADPALVARIAETAKAYATLEFMSDGLRTIKLAMKSADARTALEASKLMADILGLLPKGKRAAAVEKPAVSPAVRKLLNKRVTNASAPS